MCVVYNFTAKWVSNLISRDLNTGPADYKSAALPTRDTANNVL